MSNGIMRAHEKSYKKTGNPFGFPVKIFHFAKSFLWLRVAIFSLGIGARFRSALYKLRKIFNIAFGKPLNFFPITFRGGVVHTEHAHPCRFCSF